MIDGEGTERLWSYARPFASILKEMTPSHRIDLLSDIMLHYGKRKKERMGMIFNLLFYKRLTAACCCWVLWICKHLCFLAFNEAGDLVERRKRIMKEQKTCQEEISSLSQRYGCKYPCSWYPKNDVFDTSECAMLCLTEVKYLMFVVSLTPDVIQGWEEQARHEMNAQKHKLCKKICQRWYRLKQPQMYVMVHMDICDCFQISQRLGKRNMLLPFKEAVLFSKWTNDRALSAKTVKIHLIFFRINAY